MTKAKRSLEKNYFTTTSIVHLMTSDIGDPEACRIYLLFHFGRCLAIIGLKSWVSVEGLSLLWLHSGQQTLPCTIFLCACFSCSSHPLLFFMITCWNSRTAAKWLYQAVCSSKQVYPFVRQMDLLGKYTWILNFNKVKNPYEPSYALFCMINYQNSSLKRISVYYILLTKEWI